MRRNEREITSMEGLTAVIEECKVCRIAMCGEGKPYIVPLNFGYEFTGSDLKIYIHGAKQGKKIDMMTRNPQVSFEIDCRHELVTGEAGCSYSYKYASIIGFGKAEFLTDNEEKRHGLGLLMKHQSGKDSFTFPDNALNSVAVVRITLSEYSGKHHE